MTPYNNLKMNNNITVVYNPEKRRLTLFKEDKPVGGFVGNIALRMYRQIVDNNKKAKITDGNIQPNI